MKGIASCKDCEFYITIYRFTGSQGFFSVPKKWCEECDLLISLVEKTIKELEIENKVKVTVKPWFLWFWQPLLTNFAPVPVPPSGTVRGFASKIRQAAAVLSPRRLTWHAPILIINGRLISQGTVTNKENIIKVLSSRQIVAKPTEKQRFII